MPARKLAVLFAVALALVLTGLSDLSYAERPNIPKGCKKCHTPSPDKIRGAKGTVSEKFKTLQVAVGEVTWVVNYDENTRVREGDKSSGPERLKALPKGKSILVSYTGGESKPLAGEVAVKQPYKVPAEKLISAGEMKKLVAMGTEKGRYTLVDARPPAKYMGGHIPTAKSLPYGAFGKKYATVLPEDRGGLIIFYCGGPT
jgi:hypothetical protein